MSKIEVNTVEPQCGTTLTVGKCTTNLRSGGNSLQAADGGNLISQSGTDITLGASGDTINLASGASQSGFGRTGTVDWVTTPKTAGFTAATGSGYFCNTTSGIFTVALPAGAAGSIVSLADYAATWQTNNLTISPDGTDKIGGVNTTVALSTEGQSVTLVYVDSTQGWVNTMDSTSNIRAVPPYIQATGGTPTQSGDYEIRTFTGPGTFCVTSLSPSAPKNAVDWMVVAGGGGGSPTRGGGGGAGGFRESPGTATGSYTASPIAGGSAVSVTVQGYPIAVGSGGTVPCSLAGGKGNTSTFSSYDSAGGGGGARYNAAAACAGAGGSGGGGTACVGGPGAGNTPPVSPAQGFAGGAGGAGPGNGAGGGGGALAVGTNGTSPQGGNGGPAATSCITGSPVARAGGGGGGVYAQPNASGGVPGGGGGGAGGTPGCANGVPGSANTGGGGGGGWHPAYPAPELGGTGGSGVVILRYKFK